MLSLLQPYKTLNRLERNYKQDSDTVEFRKKELIRKQEQIANAARLDESNRIKAEKETNYKILQKKAYVAQNNLEFVRKEVINTNIVSY